MNVLSDNYPELSHQDVGRRRFPPVSSSPHFPLNQNDILPAWSHSNGQHGRKIMNPAAMHGSSSTETLKGWHRPSFSKNAGTQRPNKNNFNAKNMQLKTPMDFCPWLAVSRFPYKYVRGDDSDRIAKSFFDQGKFWERTWDIYYIQPPFSVSSDPILLVPISQVQELIDEINKALGSKIILPTKKGAGFLLRFRNDGTPKPKFLSVSKNRQDKDEMTRIVPRAETDPGELPENCSPDLEQSFEAWRELMELANESSRNKKGGRGEKDSKGRKLQDQVGRLQSYCRMMKKSQCYFGLTPRRPDNPPPAPDQTDMPLEKQRRLALEYDIAIGCMLPPFNPTEKAQFPFEKLPIFICVDIEWNERSQSQITEIGVSTLDTAELVNMPPGEGGHNWMDKIRTRHFRIEEHAHVVNSSYIRGCPDNFEFGDSEFIPFESIAVTVGSCFVYPYSAFESQQSMPMDKRNLILVGHDVDSDMRILYDLCLENVFDQPNNGMPRNSRFQKDIQPKLNSNFIDIVDTCVLYRVLKRSIDSASLARILVSLDMVGWNFHNAGNDAHYTMQALIGIVIKASTVHPTTKGDDDNSWPLISRFSDLDTENQAMAFYELWKQEIERRAKNKPPQIAARVRVDCANWEVAVAREGEMSGFDA